MVHLDTMNSTEKHSLSSLSLYEKNMIMRLFLGRGGLGLLRFPAILGSLFCLLYFTCRYEGCLVGTDPSFTGLLQDSTNYGLLAGMLLAIFGTYRLLGCLASMRKRIVWNAGPAWAEDASGQYNIVLSGIEKLVDFVGLQTRFARRLYRAVIGAAILLVVLFQIVFPVTHVTENVTWALSPYRFPMTFIVATIWTFFWMVMVAAPVTWYIFSSGAGLFRLLRRLRMQRALHVIPVAPDGRGGLQHIGKVAFAITLVAASGIPFTVFWPLVVGYNAAFFIGSTAYFTALICLFFLPLISLRSIMMAAKEHELERLAQLYADGYHIVFGDNPSKRNEAATMNSMQIILYLGALDRLYERARSMPVWPFDLQTLGWFISLVIVPFLVNTITGLAQSELIPIFREAMLNS